MIETLTEKEKFQLLQFRVHEHKIGRIWEILRGNGLSPILIKGWAAARNYPKPFARRIGDIDIALAPEEYAEALGLLGDSDNCEVDFHEGLRHLDEAAWSDLYARSETANCGAAAIRILRPEDHLRVLCAHWLNDGGTDREKLYDVSHLIENRAADFDWDLCLGAATERRRTWMIYTIGLAHKYLNLPIDDLPFAGRAKSPPVWLTRTIEREWRGGVRVVPLDACLKDKKMFFRQMRKRFPPNPVQATVEMDGDFDSRTRIFYQAGSFIKRAKPSIKRVWKAFTRND